MRTWTEMVVAGVWLTYAVSIAAGAWVVLTADEPNRPAMAVVLAAAAGLAFAVSRLPTARIVHGRWRELFFLGWSAADIAFIGFLAVADGGVGSPANALFFLTVAFAALAYPLRSVVAVSVFNLAVFVVVGVLTRGRGDPDLSANMWLFASCLTATSAMCGWQSHIQTDLRDELARACRTDPLTGALNRRGFEELLDRERARGAGFGLLVLDLDHFKSINDTLGHSAGDDLLRWTVRAMTDALAAAGSDGAVARLGGDEFAVVLHETGPAETSLMARRLRTILSAKVGATTGVAAFPADAATLDALHRHADAELYAAKRARPTTPAGTRDGRPAPHQRRPAAPALSEPATHPVEVTCAPPRRSRPAPHSPQ